MWHVSEEDNKQNIIQYYSPDPIKVNKINLKGFKIQSVEEDLSFKDKTIAEVRIYTDNAKTRLFKPGIIQKINKQIKEYKKLSLDNLPKRIKNSSTENIKIVFITLEGDSICYQQKQYMTNLKH